MSFDPTGFYDAIAEMLCKEGLDAAKVTDVDSEIQYEGYCETCSYATTVLEITYLTSEGRSKLHTFEGTFASLMYALS